MSRRHTLLALSVVAVLTVATLVACRKDGLAPEQRAARQAATEIVGMVVDGRAEGLADALAYMDSCDAGYHAIMVDVMRDHIAAMASCRGGIVGYAATHDTIAGNVAQVFVELAFADSTSEEIDIPLTLVNGLWQLR